MKQMGKVISHTSSPERSGPFQGDSSMIKFSLAVVTAVLALAVTDFPHAQAASRLPAAEMYEIKIDPSAQRLTTLLASELGVADADLDCGDGQVALKGVRDINNEIEDAKTLPTLLAANVIRTGPSRLSLQTLEGRLTFTCQNGVLLTDFSDVAKKSAIGISTRSTNSTFSFFQGSAGINLQVPVNTHPTTSGGHTLGSLSIRFRGTRLGNLKTVVGLGTNGQVVEEDQEALFWYDSTRNVLTPLISGGNNTLDRFKERKVPAQLVFFFVPNVQQNDHWRRIVIDTRTFTTWNEASSKPRGATFAQ